MIAVVICEKMGWRYEDYLSQPNWFIELLIEKIRTPRRRRRHSASGTNTMALFGGDNSLQVVIRLKDEFSNSLKKVQSQLDSFQDNFQRSADASRQFALA